MWTSADGSCDVSDGHVCSCGRKFSTEKGLKIHQGKKGCPISSESDDTVNRLPANGAVLPTGAACLCGKMFNTEKGLKIHQTKMGCLTNATRRPTSTDDVADSADHVPKRLTGASCLCGKRFNTDKGLKIHQSKVGCLTSVVQRSASTELAGKTRNVTGPDVNHSPECVPVTTIGCSPPRQKIKIPPIRDKKAWQDVDQLLWKNLREATKRDDSVKAFTDVVFSTSLAKFGSKPVGGGAVAKTNRRQAVLARLRGEKRLLRRQWKKAGEFERAGLAALWKDVGKRISDLSRAENTRRKKYEKRKARQNFFRDPYQYGRSLLEPPKSGTLQAGREMLEEHLRSVYSSGLSNVPLVERDDIPVVPLPTTLLNLAAPSYEEIKKIVKKARNRSAPGPNGIPYVLYKRCPRLLKALHTLIEAAWVAGRIDIEWKKAEGVYIPKEKDSRDISQFRPISLLNVEGKIFFTALATRLTQYVIANHYVDKAIQKGGVPGVPGCIEHTTMIWEAIQRARKNQLSLYVVWLDLANAYGSVPHQLLWKTLEAHHVPNSVVKILQDYFQGFSMRFSTRTYTTAWVPLQVGIAMGCAISPCLFVMAMQILLNAVGGDCPIIRVGRSFSTTSIKAFMDDTTLVMNSRRIVQKTLDRLDELLQWCGMAFKPAKSRSLALKRGKVCEEVFFTVAGQRIPSISAEPVKSLGRVFSVSLKDKDQEEAVRMKTRAGIKAIGEAQLPGRFKVWLLQFVLIPRLIWPLTIYEISLPVVEALERCIDRVTRKWLGFPPGLTSVALYGKTTKIRLPLKSIVEEYKVSKIRTQLMINNSEDKTIQESRPMLKSGRKFRADDEIEQATKNLAFEEIRGAIRVGRCGFGWDHFPRWSKVDEGQRAKLVVQERRRDIENARVTKAIQQAQQGQWTKWDDALHRTIPWDEIWGMPPLRLAFVVRSIYDQLPSKDNLKRWGVSEDTRCVLCGGEQSLRHVLSGCTYSLAKGRFTWRHNRVLEVLTEAMSAACAKANMRNWVPQSGIRFLREGAQDYKSRCRTPGKNLLVGATDWSVAADIKGLRRFPREMQESGKRPDAVLTSQSAATLIIMELTVPWEDRMGTSNAIKNDKYSDLVLDLTEKGFKVYFFAVEVGARGLVGRSVYAFLREIGLPNKERAKIMKKMSRVTEASSHWLWLHRDIM